MNKSNSLRVNVKVIIKVNVHEVFLIISGRIDKQKCLQTPQLTLKPSTDKLFSSTGFEFANMVVDVRTKWLLINFNPFETSW